MPEVLDYEPPKRDPNKLPTDVMIIAWVYIAFGLICGVEMVRSLLDRQAHLNPGIFSLPMGWGLLKRSALSRGLVHVVLALNVCCIPPMLLVLIFFKKPAPIVLSGNSGGTTTIPVWVVFIIIGAIWVFIFWQYRVLDRAEVKHLFHAEDRRADDIW